MDKLPQLVILAGGLATRLKPLSEKFPKSMIEINGEPFIFHQLKQVRNKGIRRVLICIGYKGNQIKEAVGSGKDFGLEVSYSEEKEENLLGTGGALLNAMDKLENYFFIMYGDSWLNINFKELFLKFKNSKKSGVISILENNNKWDKSNISFVDGEIVDYSKDDSKDHTYIDYGVSIFKKSIFLKNFEKSKFDLGMIFLNLLSNKDLDAFIVYDRFYEIGSPKGISETSKNINIYQ